MNLPYLLTYTDHRRDAQEVRCSAFEDAERLAQVLADLYGYRGPVKLTDGGAHLALSWLFYPGEDMPCRR